MTKNKYNSFFDKYRCGYNKNNEYLETYNHIKGVYTKQLGITVNNKMKEIIKYEKIKIEGLFLKKIRRIRWR